MKKKFVVLNSVICCLLAVLFIAANVALGVLFDLITSALGGYGLDLSSEEAKAVQDEAIDFTKEITAEGIVLLRNERDTLPLEDTDKVNLFGWSSTNHIVGGSGGSGGASTIEVSLKDSFEAAGFTVNEELWNMYVGYQEARTTETEEGRYTTSWSIPEPALGDKDYYTDALLESAKQFSDTAVLVISRGSGEGVDIPEGYLSLTQTEKDLAKYLTENYKNVIAVINSNSVMEIGYLEEVDVEAILFMPGTGAYGADSLGKIVGGEVNPSGHLVDTMAYDHKSSPAYYFANKPGTMEYSDLAGWYYVDYVESIYVGYKYYETAAAEGYIDYDKTVQYPFGHGLSYTQFEKEVVDVRGNLDSDVIEVDVRVTNVGDTAGKEVVQIYATPEYYEGGIEKAHVDLVGFEKTALLAPNGQEGSEQVVTVEVEPYEIASYDWDDADGDGKTGYVLEEGKYELKLMDNAHDLVQMAATFELEKDIYIEEDPVTGAKIQNLFDDVAGQEETQPVQYLSRADFAGTFPQRENTESSTGRAASSAVKAVSDKNNIQYSNDANAQPIVTEQENNLRLFTLADGTFATQAQLEGDLADGQELVLNEELFSQLYADDDSPLWDDLLDQLSLDEMKGLIVEAQFGTHAIESIGLLATHHSDGPQGVSSFSAGDGGKGINYPVQEYIAQTWNKEIAAKQGNLFGREARVGGIAGMYAPAANIHRTPYSGRNFEYYSEDGFLSGQMAAKVIHAGREQGIFMYMKHFALNDQDQFRGENTTSLMTWSNEQAIREIYVKPFEIAVKEGNATAIMTSFNRIGATWTGASKALLTDLLRTEWGFKGSTITDLHMHYGVSFAGVNYDEWWMNSEQGIRAGQDSWLVLADVGIRPELDLENATTQNAMRESVKHIIYTVAQSNVSPNVVEPTWFYIALPIDIAVGVLIAAYAVFIVVKAKQKGKEEKAAKQ